MDRRYDIIINRVIDGDSMDIDIDLGFGVVLKNRRLRLDGVDTPESRTSDDEERKYGLLAKAFVQEWCGGGSGGGCEDGNTFILVIKRGGKESDKFGRILGDIENCRGDSLVGSIISNYHGVLYEGQNKDDVRKAHIENRYKLSKSGG